MVTTIVMFSLSSDYYFVLFVQSLEIWFGLPHFFFTIIYFFHIEYVMRHLYRIASDYNIHQTLFRNFWNRNGQ